MRLVELELGEQQGDVGADERRVAALPVRRDRPRARLEPARLLLRLLERAGMALLQDLSRSARDRCAASDLVDRDERFERLHSDAVSASISCASRTHRTGSAARAGLSRSMPSSDQVSATAASSSHMVVPGVDDAFCTISERLKASTHFERA